MGSLSGADPCQRVTQGHKGALGTDGNRALSVKVKERLTATLTGEAGAKAGLSDPPMHHGCARSLTDKSYSGDNSLVALERP